MKQNSFHQRIIFFYYALMCTSFLFLPTTSMVAKQKRMKILMVVPSFPKIHDICMLNQMTGLIDRGHDVTIYAFNKGDCTVIQEDVIKYNLLSKTIFETLPESLDDYDIVVFQLGHKALDIKRTHNFKGKVVICLRGYDITGFLKDNPHWYDTYRDTCDLFLPVCEKFKTILETIGCDPRKIIVHHSAIDCSRFTFRARNIEQNEVIKIVSAGRFVEKKGFIHAIRAMALLMHKYPYFHYTLIGEGVLKKKYEKSIKKLHLEDRITIDSWYAHDEYIKILDQSHICLLPSVTAQNNDQEGIPNVLKEAMAMGLIVVGTDHSGNTELITHGISGFLVPERNSKAIANTLEYIINNFNDLSSMQLVAKSKIHNEFDKEKENDKLEAIFLRLIKSKVVE
jgi:colanic acid/amylovoran/stewartan biosynthesis glycosyltransferase WcaL/AmsK/CpsK